MSSSRNVSLTEFLQNEIESGYGLALSPGFFCFYSHVGFLHALAEANLLHVTHASGSSAGAMVSGFLAAGKHPFDIIDLMLSIDVSIFILYYYYLFICVYIVDDDM
jgi:predicted acylesterase/phospholipase RssA